MDAMEENKYLGLLHNISFFIQTIIHVCQYLDFQMHQFLSYILQITQEHK